MLYANRIRISGQTQNNCCHRFQACPELPLYVNYIQRVVENTFKLAPEARLELASSRINSAPYCQSTTLDHKFLRSGKIIQKTFAKSCNFTKWYNSSCFWSWWQDLNLCFRIISSAFYQLNYTTTNSGVDGVSRTHKPLILNQWGIPVPVTSTKSGEEGRIWTDVSGVAVLSIAFLSLPHK